MILAAAIAVRDVVKAVMNEVLEQDERSDKDDDTANRFRVVSRFCGKESSRHSVECVKKCEGSPTHPRVSARCGHQRDGDKDAAIPRKHERIHKYERYER
jgi:hypothetical protein